MRRCSGWARGRSLCSSSSVCTPRRADAARCSAVQHVDGGPGVGERPVAGLGGARKNLASVDSLQLGASSRVSDPAGELGGVDDRVTPARVAVRGAGGLEEADVERRRCARPARRRAANSRNAGSTDSIARRRDHHRVGDAGQHRDERRDRRAGVDQGRELAEHLAAADLDRADLGDRVLGRPSRRSSPGRRRRTSPRSSGVPSSSRVPCTPSSTTHDHRSPTDIRRSGVRDRRRCTGYPAAPSSPAGPASARSGGPVLDARCSTRSSGSSGMVCSPKWILRCLIRAMMIAVPERGVHLVEVHVPRRASRSAPGRSRRRPRRA